MTNLKKIGLTALAGALASTTFAQAGEVTVSGNAIMEFQTNEDRNNNNTDGFVMNSTLTFSGSGELDNGMSFNMYQSLASGSVTSEGVTLDMGDMGKIGLDSWGYHGGITSIADKVPTAGENVHDDTFTSNHDNPSVGVAKIQSSGEDTLSYTVSPAEGFTFTSSLAFGTNGSEESAAIIVDAIEGLSVGAGIGTNYSTATVTDGGVNEDDVETYFATYTMGPVSVGYQQTKVDGEVANTDIEADHYGISFAVNESISISYGERNVEFDSKSLDEESKGISASYTAGGLSVIAVNNEKENAAGTAVDDEMMELKLVFAF
jgi:outer membrane protein OmpU